MNQKQFFSQNTSQKKKKISFQLLENPTSDSKTNVTSQQSFDLSTISELYSDAKVIHQSLQKIQISFKDIITQFQQQINEICNHYSKKLIQQQAEVEVYMQNIENLITNRENIFSINSNHSDFFQQEYSLNELKQNLNNQQQNFFSQIEKISQTNLDQFQQFNFKKFLNQKSEQNLIKNEISKQNILNYELSIIDKLAINFPIKNIKISNIGIAILYGLSKIVVYNIQNRKYETAINSKRDIITICCNQKYKSFVVLFKSKSKGIKVQLWGLFDSIWDNLYQTYTNKLRNNIQVIISNQRSLIYIYDDQTLLIYEKVNHQQENKLLLLQQLLININSIFINPKGNMLLIQDKNFTINSYYQIDDIWIESKEQDQMIQNVQVLQLQFIDDNQIILMTQNHEFYLVNEISINQKPLKIFTNQKVNKDSQNFSISIQNSILLTYSKNLFQLWRLDWNSKDIYLQLTSQNPVYFSNNQQFIVEKSSKQEYNIKKFHLIKL